MGFGMGDSFSDRLPRSRKTSEVACDDKCDDTTSEVFRDLGGLSEKGVYFSSGGMVTVKLAPTVYLIGRMKRFFAAPVP